MTILLACVAWLLTYVVHSTLLLGGALLLTAVRIVRSHAAKDTLWKVALTGGLVTATAQLALRVQPVGGYVALAAGDARHLVDVASVAPRLRAESAAVRSGETATVATWSASAPGIASAPAPVDPAPRVRRLLSGVNVSWPGVLLDLWLVGAVGFGFRILWLRLAMRRRLRDRRPLDEGPLVNTLSDLARAARIAPPRLSISDRLRGPIAFAGEIVLPVRVAREMAPCAQRAVLAHELGHIVRRDPGWLVAASLVESVFFFQPLNRLARRRLREASEFLCDAWAAERAGGLELARCLAEVAEWMQAAPELAPVAGMAEHGGQLVSRVESLLEGRRAPPRPFAWAFRGLMGLSALIAVAWAVPGVAAEDVGAAWSEVSGNETTGEDWTVKAAAFEATSGAGGWASIREGGRLISLHAGWSVRLSGTGRIGFRQWGRAFVVPEGYRVMVNGQAVEDDRELCEEDELVPIRLVGADGRWELTPVRTSGVPAYADHGRRLEDLVASALRRSEQGADAQVRAHVDTHVDIAARADADLDHEVDVQLDAAIDSLVEIWSRDPAAARRVARRLARAFERDLRPQFESLGVALGRELAPQLERVTARTARDLAPEFERLGVSLANTILQSRDGPAARPSGKKPRP